MQRAPKRGAQWCRYAMATAATGVLAALMFATAVHAGEHGEELLREGSELRAVADAILANEVVPPRPSDVRGATSEHLEMWRGNTPRVEVDLPRVDLRFEDSRKDLAQAPRTATISLEFRPREIVVKHSLVAANRFQRGYRFLDRGDMFTKSYIEGIDGSSVVVIAPRVEGVPQTRAVLVCPQEATLERPGRSVFSPSEFHLTDVQFYGSAEIEGAQLTGLAAGTTDALIEHSATLPEAEGLSDRVEGKDPRAAVRYLSLLPGPRVAAGGSASPHAWIRAELRMQNASGFWRGTSLLGSIEVHPIVLESSVPIRTEVGVGMLLAEPCYLIYRAVVEETSYGRVESAAAVPEISSLSE